MSVEEARPADVPTAEARRAPLVSRRQDVARRARTLCWLWILPLGACAACLAYLVLLFTGFAAEASGTGFSAAALAMAVGIPCAILAGATVLGLTVASFGAQWLAGAVPRAAPWVVATVAASAGGALAVGSFYVAVNGAV